MQLSRRELVIGGTMAATLAFPAAAADAGYRATVGVFLYGGNDGWNMAIPTDARHAVYRAARGSVAIGAELLRPLTGVPFALHPAMDALRPLWDEGALALVLDAGASEGACGHWEAQQRWPAVHAAPRGTLARQLAEVGRAIASRPPGAAPEQFRVVQGGYDTHARQAATHAALLGELSAALAAFHRAMRARGLAERVTVFTMSDFGRAWRGNAAGGTDHGWATNHLVVGGGLAERRIHGAWPVPGREAAPAIAQADYLAAVAGTRGRLPLHRG